jgi:hypothetical protein
MALSFNKVKGSASKEKTPSYKMREGENRIRLVGGILARYIYWIPNKDGVKTPVECLSFNRENEKFDNAEKDWVKEYYPDITPEWAYASLCFDLKDPGKILIFNHKKKLFGNIVSMVEDLGDPTDLNTGWDLVFNKAKTGPKIYNVDYTIMQLKCKTRALSAEEKTMVEAYPVIDEILRRPPPEDIKKYLDELRSGAPSKNEGMDDEIPEEFS